MKSIKGKLTENFWIYVESCIHSEVPLDGTWEIELKPYKKDRSAAQRRLQHVWYTYISEAGERQESKLQVERYCKYTFGLPILKRDNEKFSEIWNHQSQFMTYEQCIDAMEFLPVTRLFTIKQNTEYLEEMKRHYQMAGIHLPSADDLYYEAMGYKR